MMKLTEGDLLAQDDVDAVVNAVNCVGVMGKGIALQFKHRWPANFGAYATACQAGQVRPGRMFIHDLGRLVQPNHIINFPTKEHWREESRIQFIKEGLVRLGGAGSAPGYPLDCDPAAGLRQRRSVLGRRAAVDPGCL